MDMSAKGDGSLSLQSLDLIEPNLYLGKISAAINVDTLIRHKITHILTIHMYPLPRNILELKSITTKFIPISDQPKEDLLSHFDNTDAFITEALSKGAILVHCVCGVSRSATVVIAHIMKKHKLKCIDAFKKVKSKRKSVYPNPGFMSQLKLYEEMGYKLDPKNMNYKKFRLNIAANQIKGAKILPQVCMDLVQKDPGSTQELPKSNVYRCRNCNRVLASESNIVTHKVSGKVCTQMYFIEPLAWMNVARTIGKKLYCPKCKAEVGSFSWTKGCQCLCGVTEAPAFCLIPSKVNFTKVVKSGKSSST